MTTLVSSLFMIPREMPSYLQVAYDLRYANEPNEGNCFTRVYTAAQRTFALIQELLYYRPFPVHFLLNIRKLQADFARMNAGLGENEKPICVYFVSSHDTNGAILGNQLYYYHHYKIQNLQKHFAVAPKIVSSQAEMKEFMQELRRQYPQRQIQFVDVVSHGTKSSICIEGPDEQTITPERLRPDLFEDCAPDASILLDACLTGLGDKNIGDEIARNTPGRTVLAPGPTMYFSKPVIETVDGVPKVVSAVHGFAIANAYTCKSFSYPERMPSQFPYVKFESFQSDIVAIANCPFLQNSWLDPYLNVENVDQQQEVRRVFEALSPETRGLIAKQVWMNNGSALNLLPEVAGAALLHAHPLDPIVRSAFRTVFNELVQEVREYPPVFWARVALFAKNVIDAIAAPFRNCSS